MPGAPGAPEPNKPPTPFGPLPPRRLTDAEVAALRAPYEELIAARRAGASWEELHAVTGLAYLFRGMPAANLGAEILLKLAEGEAAGAPPGVAR